MGSSTKINKKAEADRIFNQLCEFKKAITRIKREIKCRRNQFSILFNNSLSRYDIDIDLDDAYKKYYAELKKINLKNLEKYRGHYTRCFNERCDIVAKLSRLEFENINTVTQLQKQLGRVTNPKKYSFFKRRINDYQKLIIDEPLKIIENCFDAEIVRPQPGNEFVSGQMEDICLTNVEVIDTFKEIHKVKLGSFVDQCIEYGAKDKKTGEYIITPAVSIYSVELADRLKMFQFVK